MNSDIGVRMTSKLRAFTMLPRLVSHSSASPSFQCSQRCMRSEWHPLRLQPISGRLKLWILLPRLQPDRMLLDSRGGSLLLRDRSRCRDDRSADRKVVAVVLLHQSTSAERAKPQHRTCIHSRTTARLWYRDQTTHLLLPRTTFPMVASSPGSHLRKANRHKNAPPVVVPGSGSC